MSRSINRSAAWRPSAATLRFTAALAFCAGCAHRGQTLDVSELEPSQKIIVGDVRLEGGDLDQWVQGAFQGATLVLDYELPTFNRKVRVTPLLSTGKFAHFVLPTSVDPQKNSLDERSGGAFRIGIENRNAYLISVYVRSTLFLAQVATVFPLYVWIQPSSHRCEYIGTLVLRRENEQTIVRVMDDYEQFQSDKPSFVTGCALNKSLATVLTPAQIRAYEASLPAPRALDVQ